MTNGSLVTEISKLINSFCIVFTLLFDYVNSPMFHVEKGMHKLWKRWHVFPDDLTLCALFAYFNITSIYL